MEIEKRCDNCLHQQVNKYCHHSVYCLNDQYWEPRDELFIAGIHDVIATDEPVINIYKARAAGREYCQTEGSEHYKADDFEPMDLIINKGMAEDFCLGNIIKYATRFSISQNLDDLKKCSDYAQILCGVKLNGM